MKVNKAWLAAVVFLPLSLWGSMNAIRSLVASRAMRDALTTANEKRPLLGPNYPAQTTTENLRRYGIATEKVDVSHAPAEFRDPFREWAQAWKRGADETDAGLPGAKERADRRVRDATKKLSEAQKKLGG